MHLLLCANLTAAMDKFVAQYSRARHQHDFFSEQEQFDLTETAPPLALKFDLPPIENVRESSVYGFKKTARGFEHCGASSSTAKCTESFNSVW